MKAIAFRKHGDESVLELLELPEPKPSARGVMVRVKAVALNHLDLWVRRGWPGLKLELPHMLGSDVAGVVEQVGAEVTDLPVGTEVLVNPGLSCGVCEQCLSGKDNLCRGTGSSASDRRRVRGAGARAPAEHPAQAEGTSPSKRRRACRSPS